MISVTRYEELKRMVDDQKRVADRAAGALDRVMIQLKEDFGCSTLKQAVEKEKKLKKEAEKVEAEFKTALEKFELEWGDRLEGE